MTDREVMQMALAALENSSPDQYPEDAGVFYDAIAALRTALEQQAEPVSLMNALNFFTEAERVALWKRGNYSDSAIANITQAVLNKIRTAPPQQQAEPAQDPKYMVQSNGRHSPLLSHMMNKRIALEQQQAEQAEQAEQAKHTALESTYHPCTSILIQGLKKLKAWDVLAEWDRERGIVDERLNTATKQQQVEPCQFCGLTQCDPRCMWIQKDIGVEQAEPVSQLGDGIFWCDTCRSVQESTHHTNPNDRDVWCKGEAKWLQGPFYTAPHQ